jgi:C-terminal processing protease CtpA/Prc
MELQPGDVITEIDGTPLNDPAVAWEVLRQLPEGSVLSATVHRQGGTAHVTLDGTLIVRAEERKAQQPSQAMLTPGP